MAGKYRKFSPEFREEAARMVVETSRAIADVARELGIRTLLARSLSSSVGSSAAIARGHDASAGPVVVTRARAPLSGICPE